MTKELKELLIKEGTWVRTEMYGERVVGFVVEMNESRLCMLVTQDESGEIKGKTKVARISNVQAIKDTDILDVEGYIRNMLDIALDTQDKTMFKRYSSLLRKLKKLDPPKKAVAV